MKHTEKKRILIIEDEMHIAEGVKVNLVFQGHEAVIAQDGVSAIQIWRDWRPDLIILDIMLPLLDGLSVLRNIRLEDEKIPILILSAKSAPDDRVRGFIYGVDDYLSKPFNLEELLLRVDRLLTRLSWNTNNDIAEDKITGFTYTFGENRIDFKNRIAYSKQGTIHLTEQEVKLLRLFISNQGKPLSRRKLLEIGWGYARGTTTRTVDNFVVRLRKYFEDDPKNPVFFKSLRKVGYIFLQNGTDAA